MRIFAISDVHIDYDVNARWVENVSSADYQDDVLILAGDVSDRLGPLGWCLSTLVRCFRKVLFVPGNHELWVARDARGMTSLQKFVQVAAVARSSGACTEPFSERGISIVPLLGWYDYSFGEPSQSLKSMWMDFHACRWPHGLDERGIAEYFAAANDKYVGARRDGEYVITFSHFLPRIDLMPDYIPLAYRELYPILGSTLLEWQLRALEARIHVYGHSHVNRQLEIDGVRYVNNAFGNPDETRISQKCLLCIHEQ
jgi:predicted phosphodiesterase